MMVERQVYDKDVEIEKKEEERKKVGDKEKEGENIGKIY